jgi:hypothetical protein
MNEKVAFLPFHAINEFMRDDFRLSVIRAVLNNISNLSDETQNKLNKQINKHIKIPGFRNPAKSPSPLKLIPTIKAFEKNPDLVAAFLSAWVEGKSELKENIYGLLKLRNWLFYEDKYNIKDILNDWRILPIDTDRTLLPGFYSIWPKGENFDLLYEAYSGLYPGTDDSIDTVSLMIVWISMRLPYQVEDETDLEHVKIE